MDIVEHILNLKKKPYFNEIYCTHHKILPVEGHNSIVFSKLRVV